METIIGFAAGYLVGTTEGKAGLKRLQESWRVIRTSPEVRRLASDGLSLAEAMARQATSRGLGAVSHEVARTLASRAAGGRPRSEAA